MATFLPPELREFSALPLSVAGKTIALGDLVYASQEDRWTTSGIAISSNAIAANSKVRFFQNNIGEAGQGFTAVATETETNNENGARFQGNEVYVSVGVGFQLYTTSGVDSLAYVPFTNAADVQKIADGLYWTHKVGAGPERKIGSVAQFPYGAGVYGIGTVQPSSAVTGSVLLTSGAQNGGPNVPMRKFAMPMVFPPNIEVVLNLACGTSIASLTATGALAIRSYMRGYRFTLPV
jgi:hypothetical protein